VHVFFFETYNITCDSKYYSPRHVYYSALCNTNGALSKFYGSSDIRRVVKHSPFVLFKHVYEKIFDKWGPEIYTTLLHRFRHPRDTLFHYLHHYYVIYEGWKHNFTHYIEPLGDLEYDAVLYRIEDHPNALNHIFSQITTHQPRFYTMNDNFNSDEISIRLRQFLSKQYPISSSFEKDI